MELSLMHVGGEQVRKAKHTVCMGTPAPAIAFHSIHTGSLPAALNTTETKGIDTHYTRTCSCLHSAISAESWSALSLPAAGSDVLNARMRASRSVSLQRRNKEDSVDTISEYNHACPGERRACAPLN